MFLHTLRFAAPSGQGSLGAPASDGELRAQRATAAQLRCLCGCSPAVPDNTGTTGNLLSDCLPLQLLSEMRGKIDSLDLKLKSFPKVFSGKLAEIGVFKFFHAIILIFEDTQFYVPK